MFAAFFIAFFAVLPSILFAQSTPATPKNDEPAKAAAKDADDGGKAQEWPAEIWVHPVKVEIDEDSPLRNDAAFNKPPKVYIVCKKNSETIGTCPAHAGWSVEFPKDDQHEVLIGDGTTDEYTIEAWDNQLRSNKLLFSIGPFKGSNWREKLTDPTTKRFEEGKAIAFRSGEKHATVSLSYAGTRIWYRLVNVTIPPASPHRNDDKLNKPPRLQVCLKVDGEYYGDNSTRLTGWTADFPKVASNCWTVREGTKRRYTVEVFDNQSTGWQLIFAVTGLSAEHFRDVIWEDVGPLVEKTRASTITFEQIQNRF
jgi:hypothetical protein